MGDFNIELKTASTQRDFLFEIVKQLGSHVQDFGPTRVTSTTATHIDFAVTGGSIKLEKNIALDTKTSSDHKAIHTRCSIPMTPTKLVTMIPDKKLAIKMSTYAVEKANTFNEFCILMDQQLAKVNYNILKKVSPRVRPRPLLQKILDEVNLDKDLGKLISDYYADLSSTIEEGVLSVPEEMKKNWDLIKKIYRYNEHKKEGEIIHRVRLEDGTVSYDPDTFGPLILGELRKTQTAPTEIALDVITPFPTYDNGDLLPNWGYWLQAVASKNKGIAFDGLHDCIFHDDYQPKMRQLLGTMLREPLVDNEFTRLMLIDRLVCLNKCAGKKDPIPNKTQFRPIAVGSPGNKLHQAFCIESLSKYMVHGLHRGQTGFVPGMGTLVNTYRLIKQVNERRLKKKHCYGLFIDFSSAYNTILHPLLYERLKGILTDKQIQHLRAVNERLQTKLGKQQFHPTAGVEQGSTISPFLFNIYMEPLLHKIGEEAMVSVEDVMAYADDILILCSSVHQLRQVIKVLKEWSLLNNLHLNAAKSGIIEFKAKHARGDPNLKTSDMFEGIPVVDKYRYLGTIINGKLTTSDHLEEFKGRIESLAKRLYPLLKQSSFSFRRHLWNVLARPLFEQLSLLSYNDRTATGKVIIERAIKGSFKKFMLIQSSVKDEIVLQLMDYDYEQRAEWNWMISEYKWNSRLGRQGTITEKPTFTESTLLQELIPGNFSTLLNLDTRECPKCKGIRLDHQHRLSHGIKSLEWQEVRKACRDNTAARPKKEIGRRAVLEENNRIIEDLLEEVKKIG